jgi:hypothetical protein
MDFLPDETDGKVIFFSDKSLVDCLGTKKDSLIWGADK